MSTSSSRCFSDDADGDAVELTGVRRGTRAERSLTPVENLKAWELSHGLE